MNKPDPQQVVALRGGGRPHYEIAQLAERWHCSPQTIRQNWRKWGLHGMRFGRRMLFSADDVEAVERRRAGE
jgi:hypothetical protein